MGGPTLWLLVGTGACVLVAGLFIWLRGRNRQAAAQAEAQRRAAADQEAARRAAQQAAATAAQARDAAALRVREATQAARLRAQELAARETRASEAAAQEARDRSAREAAARSIRSTPPSALPTSADEPLSATSQPADPTPIRPPTPTPTPTPPPEASAPAGRQPQVLVADDSKIVRVKTGRLLAQHGYAVAFAVDGLDAARQIAGCRPDVLITDVEMPEIDGFELTRQLRSDPRTADLPVIMITAADDKHRAAATQAGVSVLMGKPYAEDELMAHVASLVQASRIPAVAA